MHRRTFLLRTGTTLSLTGLAGGWWLNESSLYGQPGATPAKTYLEWPENRLPTVAEIRKMQPYLWHVADLLNAYRKQHGLAEVPLSPRMTLVAKRHVEDLAIHSPHKKCDNNLHAWSNQGKWKPGCFLAADKASYPIMWDKPKEIASYTSHGFEVAASGTRGDEPHLGYAAAVKTWQESAPHNDVILNKGVWTKQNWKAMGAVCAYGFACAWFGTAEDA